MTKAQSPVTAQQFTAFTDTMDRWRVTVQAKLDQHHKALYGNGEPGIDEMIREILRRLKAEDDLKAKRQAWLDKFQWILIPGALAIIGNFIYDVYRLVHP